MLVPTRSPSDPNWSRSAEALILCSLVSCAVDPQREHDDASLDLKRVPIS